MNGDGFTKLFSSILTSSIWSEDDKTRIMWVTVLACADKDGFCQASVPGLAAMARMSVQDAVNAITKLESPDPYSRTRDHDGRRLEQTDGGWIVVNYAKYRDRDRIERRREYLADYMREKRKAHAAEQLVSESGSAAGLANNKLTDVNAVLTGVHAVLTGVNSSASVSASSSASDSGSTGEGAGEGGRKKVEQPAYAEYGELRKVRLTAEEHAKLLHAHGAGRLAQGIDVLDSYIASSGKRYKSHYAVLKPTSWVWERVGQGGALPAQGAGHQNRLAAPFQRVPAPADAPKLYSPEELDRMIAADEARKAGAK